MEQVTEVWPQIYFVPTPLHLQSSPPLCFLSSIGKHLPLSQCSPLTRAVSDRAKIIFFFFKLFILGILSQRQKASTIREFLCYRILALSALPFLIAIFFVCF
jgi:hypothetical protein